MKKKALFISGGLTAVIYLLSPVTSRIETVVFLTLVWGCLYLLTEWQLQNMADLQALRDELSITAKRPPKRKNNFRIDNKICRAGGGWKIILPAYKVTEAK